MQCAQRVALSGIVDRQSGQSFVVGESSCFDFILLTALTIRKTTRATIRKLTTSFIKEP